MNQDFVAAWRRGLQALRVPVAAEGHGASRVSRGAPGVAVLLIGDLGVDPGLEGRRLPQVPDTHAGGARDGYCLPDAGLPRDVPEASAVLTHCLPAHLQATTRTVLMPSPGIFVFTAAPLPPKTRPLRLHTNPTRAPGSVGESRAPSEISSPAIPSDAETEMVSADFVAAGSRSIESPIDRHCLSRSAICSPVGRVVRAR